MSGGFLDIFDGVSEAVTEEDQAASVDLMYRPAEAVFGAVAKDLVAQGWACFPQDQERAPGRVKGRRIAFTKDHNLQHTLPTPEAVDTWIHHCPTLNVATVMGQGSGYSFALDIDVTDADLSARILALADEMLGESPFVRVGRAPKVAAIYRTDPEDPVRNTSRYFADTTEDGDIVPSEHAVEILTDGKPITFFGKHHKTGRYFQWLRKSPLEASPDEAPVVSGEQLALFIEAIDENIRRFHRNTNSYVEQVEYEWDETRDVTIPRIRTAAGGAPWVENRDGKIVDGREAYLTNLVFSFVKSNRGLRLEPLTELVVEQFQATAEMSGKWTIGRVRNEARSKISHLLEKVASGEIEISFRNPGAESGDDIAAGKFRMPFSKADLRERNLEFLPDSFSRKDLKGHIVEKNDPIILTDEQRKKEINDIQVGLRNALDEFFEDVFMANCGHTVGENRVHVVKAPTGAGKTSQTIRYIGEMREEHERRAGELRHDGTRDEDGNVVSPARGLTRTYKDFMGNEREGSLPIVFLLPTYANIEEVRIRAEVLNLDPGLDDEQLKQAALEKGLVPEAELESRVADMKRDAMDAGLTVLVYKGKIAAGCQMADKVQAAMEAGIGTSGFCKAYVKRDDGESEEVRCPHYEGCPAITQREMIQQADLIFTPHPFMQLSIPEELEAARAVIADERIHHLFLHTTEFPIQHLDLPRRSVRLTRADKDAGRTAEDYMLAREQAVDIVKKAFLRGECPATALREFSQALTDERGNPLKDALGETIEVTGADLLEDCIKVCSNALKKDANLNPELDLDEVLDMCAQPTGLHIREEHQFWTILQDRIQKLTDKAFVEGLSKELKALNRPDQLEERQRLQKICDDFARTRAIPRGEKDMRIQYIQEHLDTGQVNQLVRISWRTVPNWSNVPLLLLDASAAPEIINKIWGGADVKTHDIQGPLNMKVVGVVNKTFSNAAVIGDPKAPEGHKVITAQGLAKIRQAISSICSWFGDSRVVAGTSILLRKTVNTDWCGPENVDWCHYGAMRGLDFAKFHAAAFSIGRMELPIRTIDGLVAALTYDDEKPEDPFDKNGTGLKPGTKHPLMMPQQMQRLRMRSGEIVEIPTPMHPGKWGRLIQRQYREEELLQFCGRLRPVYREGEAPIWFALSSVIPEDLIIDDLIHIDDLMVGKDYIWEAARKTEGILHPTVLHQTCPELFKDEAHAAKIMEDMGFSYRLGSKKGPKSNGYTAFKIISDRTDSFAFVRTGKKHKLADLKVALTEHGISFKKLENMDKNEAVTSLARARVPDKVDDALGTPEERKVKEKMCSERANVALLCRNAQRVDRQAHLRQLPSHPIRFTAGNDDFLKHQMVTFADVEAHETLKRVWDQMAYEKELQSKNPLMQDAGDTYENLGNHVGDRDSGAV